MSRGWLGIPRQPQVSGEIQIIFRPMKKVYRSGESEGSWFLINKMLFDHSLIFDFKKPVYIKKRV